MSSSPNNNDDEDADLEDLLTSKTTSPPTTSHTTTTTTNIDLDHLTRDDGPKKQRYYHHHYHNHNTHNPSVSPLVFCYAHCCSFVYTHPCTCVCLVVAATIIAILGVIHVTLNPTSEIGVVQHDYTDVQSSFQLSMGQIDHWCLLGDNDSCSCEDPLEPVHRGEEKSWRKAAKANVEAIEKYRSDVPGYKEIDVAIVGESVVELMDGRWMGGVHKGIEMMEKGFKKRFDRSEGADLEGVALGIAGDTSPNILYRLQHGEMPPDFNPHVWWIAAGMNDIARTQCSEEVTVIGILRIAEEILERKPKAQIVINSLFPMHDLRGGMRPMRSDVEDVVREEESRRRWWRGDGNRGVPPSHVARTPEEIARIRADVMKQQEQQQQQQHHDDVDDRRYLSSSSSDSKEDEPKKHHYKPEKPNPTLSETHQFRHRDPKTLFSKMRSPPIWSAIEAINAELLKFANKHSSRVHYVDSTKLFTYHENGVTRLNTDHISWRGRPSVEGFGVWEDSIVERLKIILAEQREEEKKKESSVVVGNVEDDDDELLEEGDDDTVDDDDDDTDDDDDDDTDDDDDDEGDDDAADDDDEEEEEEETDDDDEEEVEDDDNNDDEEDE